MSGLTFPHLYLGSVMSARTLTLSPMLIGIDSSEPANSNSARGAHHPLRVSKSRKQSSSSSILVTTPTIPWVTPPQLYFGAEISARTRTLAPTVISTEPGTTVRSRTCPSQESCDSNFTRTWSSSSRAVTRPTSPTLTPPQPKVGTSMSSLIFTQLPFCKVFDGEGLGASDCAEAAEVGRAG